MTKQQSISIWRYLLSRDAIMTILIPIMLYNIAFRFGGVGIALLLTGLYSLVLKFISKTKGSLIVVALILVSGMSHYLYIHGHKLFTIKQEDVFLSVSGAISTIIVFCFYSLLGRPVVQTLAEQAMPRLKTIAVYGTPLYARVWQEVSMAWILVFLLKAIGLYALSDKGGLPINSLIFLCSSPLTLLMILFSFYWPRYRWKSKRSTDPT
ncbi:hypothetical protein [Xenorhabdus miraniensis]|uniref:Intracellular septation protein A n=1 Tax=Xenorhabdus miraniensis TaxID=351674 RepID=A0A2D0JKV1_9GAMM|nr:hypothetical protein [Xenorhabdus miraniensis]PHM46871.1 hypothetical protein Xmir_03843 [Xenorhabdus miraniensis]